MTTPSPKPSPGFITANVASLHIGDVFRKASDGRPLPTQTVAKIMPACDRHHVHIVDSNKNEGCWDKAGVVEVQV
jgi:hypothetical protein